MLGEVTHIIECATENDGAEVANSLHWTSIAPAVSGGQSYSDIEAAAAHLIAPALRDLADAIEAEVSAEDQRILSQQDEQ